MTETFTQLGVSGATLFILFFIVKFFVQNMQEKDRSIAIIVSDFNKTINNHIASRIEQAKRETEAIQALTVAIQELPTVIVNSLTALYPPNLYQNLNTVKAKKRGIRSSHR